MAFKLDNLIFWKKKKAAQESFDESVTDDANQLELELTHVGPYEIIAPVGRGGMGTVYKAIDRSRDITIAIKVLDRRYDVDKKRRKQDYLGREILIAANLNHDCIVKLHNQIVEQPDSQGNVRRCLLMEYVDGHNLRKHIRDRDLSIKQMVELSIKFCTGLDFLHQHGIVHRDIKPENFLLTRDMQHVKIVDFGLSKSSHSWRLRWTRETGGTRSYMSPEQLRKKRLDARSDIFSLGITLYELFTGRHPVTATDQKELTRLLCSSSYRFEPPSKYNPLIQSNLDRILLKMLRRKLESRYQSVTQILLDLTRLGEYRI